MIVLEILFLLLFISIVIYLFWESYLIDEEYKLLKTIKKSKLKYPETWKQKKG